MQKAIKVRTNMMYERIDNEQVQNEFYSGKPLTF